MRCSLRLRSVLEYMPLVSAAERAMVLGAWIEQFVVGFGGYCPRQGLTETRPAGAALVFCTAIEQGLKTGCANESAVAFFGKQSAAAGELGIFFKEDAIGF